MTRFNHCTRLPQTTLLLALFAAISYGQDTTYVYEIPPVTPLVASRHAPGMWLLNTPSHRIDAECFAKLRPGMTRAEVESYLGVKAGDHRPPNQRWRPYGFDWSGSLANRPRDWWVADGFEIGIRFDQSERVVYTHSIPGSRTSTLDRLLRRLGQ